jgi:hypothetical protein
MDDCAGKTQGELKQIESEWGGRMIQRDVCIPVIEAF